MNKSFRLLVVLALAVAVAVTGCTSPVSEIDVPVADVSAKIVEVIKADLLANGVSEEEMAEGLPGYVQADLLTDDLRLILADADLLDLDLVEEGAALCSMFNTSSTEILIIKAKDQAAVEQLEAALQQEKELRLEQWATYLPNQHEKVQNTVIKAEGLYLLYATYEQPDQIEAAFDSALTAE